MIPVFRPSIRKEEIDAVKEVLKSGWLGLGPKTKEFEDNFCEYSGARFASALNSCTAALHLALMAYKIDPGEVLVPAITFVSTVHAIVYNNLTPVFVDVDLDNLNIDVNDIENKLSIKTRAIIPVHFGGHPCEMDEILEICNSKGIILIEDAAHACGAQYRGKKIGTIGDITCFSFHAVKNLTTGEGGMITTDAEDIYREINALRWLGISKSTWERTEKDTKYLWYYTIEDLGYKYHMSDIAAAIGIVQLRKLEELNDRRREIVKIYNDEFKGLTWITPLKVKDYVKSAHQNYVVKIEKRDDFVGYMRENKISTGVHYMPVNLHPYYAKRFSADVPQAEAVWKNIVTLPLYPDLNEDEISKIIDTIKAFKKKFL